VCACWLSVWCEEHLRGSAQPVYHPHHAPTVAVQEQAVKAYFFSNKKKKMYFNLMIMMPLLLQRFYLALFLMAAEVKTSAFSMLACLTALAVLVLRGHYSVRVMALCSLVLMCTQYVCFILTAGESAPRVPAQAYSLLPDWLARHVTSGNPSTERLSFMLNLAVFISFDWYADGRLIMFRQVLAMAEESVSQVAAVADLERVAQLGRSRAYTLLKEAYKKGVTLMPVMLLLLNILLLLDCESPQILVLLLLALLIVYLTSLMPLLP
jgi:hypothetical protein